MKKSLILFMLIFSMSLITAQVMFDGFETGNTDGSTTINGWTQATGPQYTNNYWTANSTNTNYNRTPRTGSFNVMLQYGGEAWLFKPVSLTAGTSYTIELYARQDMTTGANIGIYFGTGDTIGDMTNTIVPQTDLVNGDYQRVFGSFTPDATQTYYIGIKGYTTFTPWYISLDDVTLDLTPTNPIFSLSPDVSSWDFGSTIINNMATKDFTITNIGGGTLSVNSITPSGAYYSISVDPSPVDLGPNESTNFTARYAPTAVGDNHIGSFVISDSRASTTVTLNGSCFDPTVTSFPWTENFDSVTVPDLPLGWSSIDNNNDGDAWQSYASNAHSAPNCASISYNSSLALNDWLLSPPIMLQAGTTYALDFKYRGGSTYYVEKLKVMLGNGSQIADLSTQIFIDENINFDSYTTANATFTVPSSGSYYLGWHAYSVANQLRLYVDDITIRIPAPIAPEPATVAFPLNGSTTLLNPMLKWTPSVTGEPATGYKLYLNTTGTFSEADLKYTGTAPQFQTTGLALGLTYSWKVVPTNALGAALACPTWTFNTPMTDQLAEGFEATSFPPVGWANGSTGAWTRSTSTPLFEGTASAYKFTSSSTVYVLSTPMLTITEGSTVDFYTRASATSQVLKMVYSTDRTTWTQIGADITYAATGIWYPISIDLGSLAGSSYYIGFQTPVHTSTGSIYVDHVIGPDLTPVLPGIPTLTAPANAAVDQSTYPTLTWSASTTGGVPSGYNIYLDTEDGSTLFDTSTGTSYSPAASLDWETTYYWKVAATNNAGTGEASAVRSFSTMSDPTIYDLPFFEGFEDGNTHAATNVANWTQEFVTGVKKWTVNSTLDTYNRAPRTGSFNVTLGWSSSTWMFRPVQLTGGTSYDVTVWARQDHVDTAHANMTIAYGTQGNAAGMVNTIVPQTALTNGDYQRLSGSFTPTTDGIYYIGILGTLPSATNWYISLDDILLRESPTGPPEPVTLNSPADGATDLPIASFELSWAPAMTGGNVETYAVLMSQNEANVDNDYYWDGITDTSFDPTQADTDPITYNYGETWYWTVMAFNGDGDALQETPFSFTIMDDPRILSLPYSENFDSVPSSSMPVAWTGYVGSANTSAYVRTSTSYPVSAPNSMYLTNSSDTAADLRLITPEILVPMNSIKLSFSARGSSTGYTLLVGTVDAIDETGTFNQIASFDLTAAHAIYTASFAGFVGTDEYICFKHGLGGTYRSIYIDDVMMEELVANDLAVTAFSGDSHGLAGDEFSYSVSVYNNGTAVQNAYNVQLLNANTEAILASISITEPLAAGVTVQHAILWTPASAGVFDVYAKVVLAGDVNAYNDASENLTVGVFAANSYTPFIGNPQSTLSTNYLPFNMFYKNSLAETIYLAHEMQMANGTINAIVYHNTFTQDITIPVKIWMAHSTATVNSGWLPFEDYSLVYDGSVFFPMGINSVVIPLQTPFSYTGGNLAVRTNRVIDTNYYSSSDKFYYSSDSANPNRSRYYNNDTTVIDPTNPTLTATGTQSSYIPNTAFIVSPYTALSLSTPVVQIAMSGSNPRLSWEAVENAVKYVIYGSNDPHNWDGAVEIATTNDLYYNVTTAPVMKFYKVAARSYNHQVREIGQVFNPAAVIGFDNSSLKDMPKTIGTENKD